MVTSKDREQNWKMNATDFVKKEEPASESNAP